MANIPKIIQHLSNRPFDQILKKFANYELDLNDEFALKLMCIMDYEMEINSLYFRIYITNCPKLLHQLLGFYSYKNFRFYEYADNSHFINKQLQCTVHECQFVGPYTLVLTHMAINHNIHSDFISCAYCSNCDLKKHIDENSFQICYEKYLGKIKVLGPATEECQIILHFYNMLKECSKGLGVYVRRQWNEYPSKRHARNLGYNDAQISKLNQRFNIVMFYGIKALSPLINNNFANFSYQFELPATGVAADAFIQDEQQPSSAMSISSVPSSRDQSDTASPMSVQCSAMSISSVPSSLNRSPPMSYMEINQSHLEQLSPFMRMLNSRYQAIKNVNRRRELEDTFWNALMKAELAEENESKENN